MQGLYEALGRIASAAHANGDKIDENTFPDDESYDRHGIDIFHNGILMRFRAVPDEPRFNVDAPIVFAPRLRTQYTPEELSERGNVEYATLSDTEQKELRETILRADLREAETYEDEFQDRIRDELVEAQPDILRLGYGEDDLWNGVLVRDKVFPYRESFSIDNYRETVPRVRSVHGKIKDIVADVPPINGQQARDRMRRSQNRPDDGPSGFQ